MALVIDTDTAVFKKTCQTCRAAESAIIDYLRRNRHFKGKDFRQASLQAGEKTQLMVFAMQPEDFTEVRDRLALFRSDLPLKEKGLYRVIYEIDVGANSALHAAKQVHDIMSDPESIPPVLDIIDDKGNKIRIDLSQRRKGQTSCKKSQTK